MTDHSKRHPSHIAYAVRDGKDGQKGKWNEIGAAWQTKDRRGLILHLNAFPIDGRVILQPRDKE